MFDANGAYIKLGQKFFAEVRSTDSQLEAMGIKQGDLILCAHISNLEDRPRFNHQTHIWTSLGTEPHTFTFTHETNEFSWLVYSGSPNGRGFIDDGYKAKAKEFLGGEWVS